MLQRRELKVGLSAGSRGENGLVVLDSNKNKIFVRPKAGVAPCS